MKNAWMLWILLALAAPTSGWCSPHGEAPHAEDSPEAAAHAAAPAHAASSAAHAGEATRHPALATPVIEAAAEEPAANGPVVAMDAKHSRSVKAGQLFTVGGEPVVLVTKNNDRVELSPHSVVELDPAAEVRLLRGSAAVESRQQRSLRTASARVDFVGRLLVSYDHRERSTSAFVLEGEARVVSPQHEDRSLRLERFRGASMVVGDVLPQLIRQLDVGAVGAWMKGFAWPEARRAEILRGMPGEAVAKVEPEAPAHLKETKIEDYFSSIDTADEFHQPNYYERKFADPDKVVAEANSKQGPNKVLSPEEAALISLPKTKIDLGFDLGPEFLTVEQKQKEVERLPSETKKSAGRRLASVEAPKARKPASVPAQAKSETGDPEVDLVLERLRSVRSPNAAISRIPASGRGPAAVAAPVVPDPVYDYSQNF